MDGLTVRQWQEKFRAGAFEDSGIETQYKAGWIDWMCRTDTLADRLKKLGKLVMGITEPYILDHYYVWFRNDFIEIDQKYDEVRFQPLSDERDGRYFWVCLDYPCGEKKWALVTERDGYGTPEFDCDNVRDMAKYIDGMAHELEHGIQPAFIKEKTSAVAYFSEHGFHNAKECIHRDGGGCYHYQDPENGQRQTVLVVSRLEDIPSDIPSEQVEKIDGLHICSLDTSGHAPPSQAKQPARRQPHQKHQER